MVKQIEQDGSLKFMKIKKIGETYSKILPEDLNKYEILSGMDITI